MPPIYALHVRTLPPPTTYAKSRAILNALQRFGRINAFISLRYFPTSRSPNACLALFDSEESLQRALQNSPLRVRPVRSGDGTEPEEEMVCELSISTTDHVKNAKANPYSGPFLIDRLTMPYHDLKAHRVPSDEYADCAVVDKTRLSSKTKQQYLEEAALPYGSLMEMWRQERKRMKKARQRDRNLSHGVTEQQGPS